MADRIAFRVHFADCAPLDIEAEDAIAARKIARCRRPGDSITKIKIVKEQARADQP